MRYQIIFITVNKYIKRNKRILS